jgi:hypothetical protein
VTGQEWGPPGKRVSEAAAGLLGRLDRSGEGMRQARAVAAWRDAAGAEVASHARGFALRGSELLVFVDSSTWANELSVLAEHYRQAVNGRIGKEAVGSIRFSVSKRVSEEVAWEGADAAAVDAVTGGRVAPVPATETEVAQIRHMAAAVKTERVREAVVAAAIRNLEWRKGMEAQNAAQTAAQRAAEAKEGLEP